MNSAWQLTFDLWLAPSRPVRTTGEKERKKTRWTQAQEPWAALRLVEEGKWKGIQLPLFCSPHCFPFLFLTLSFSLPLHVFLSWVKVGVFCSEGEGGFSGKGGGWLSFREAESPRLGQGGERREREKIKGKIRESGGHHSSNRMGCQLPWTLLPKQASTKYSIAH